MSFFLAESAFAASAADEDEDADNEEEEEEEEEEEDEALAELPALLAALASMATADIVAITEEKGVESSDHSSNRCGLGWQSNLII